MPNNSENWSTASWTSDDDWTDSYEEEAGFCTTPVIVGASVLVTALAITGTVVGIQQCKKVSIL